MDFAKVSYWKELAEYDIQTADAMLLTKRYLYVGFMCHQAIEKILKAYFVRMYTDEQVPYIHALDRLAEKSGLIQEMTEVQLNLLAKLGPLNIESRYPSAKEKIMRSLTDNTCAAIIEETKELFIWISSKL